MSRRITPRKKFMIRKKALTMLEVLKETGKFNLTEVHRRVYPGTTSENAHGANADRDIMTPEVYAEFVKLLRVDDKAVEKLGPKDIIQDILNDIEKINLALESPNIDMETTSKLLNTKSVKQKLLGSYLGIWNQDKPQESEETNPDNLFKNSRFGAN